MSEVAVGFEQVVEMLRALAEPTRCRLLALLLHGELTVGEIAETLGQSQPRISRHLKILSDVGALERFREEQRIYYRLTAGTQAAAVLAQVLRPIASSDVLLQKDRKQLVRVLEKRPPSIDLTRRVPAVVRQLARLTWSIRLQGRGRP